MAPPSTASLSHVTIHPESKFFFFVGNRITITNTLKRVKNTVFLIFSKTVTASSPSSSFQAELPYSFSHTLTLDHAARTQREISLQQVVVPCGGGGGILGEWVYPASIDYSCLQQEHTISLSFVTGGKCCVNFLNRTGAGKSFHRENTEKHAARFCCV